MFIDASALTAMLADEADATRLLAILQHAPVRRTSALAIWEAVVALSRIVGMPLRETEREVMAFLRLLEIDVVPVDLDVGHIAIQTFDRYGKGRHVAGLNFGDCFAYACARQHGLSLLYKGDDFPHTDIEAA